MDLTIASTTLSVAKKQQRPVNTEKQKSADRERSEQKKINAKKDALAKAENMKRHDKARRRKIATYHLFNDPLLKHRGAATGKTGFAAANSEMGLGTGVGYPISGSAISPQPKNGFNAPFATEYKTDSANNAGVAFDCREKAATASPTRREVTACYVHKLDKSWKTQTYVSRRFADGSPDWGGGLAVGFDY
jgi:hypothetical protein